VQAPMATKIFLVKKRDSEDKNRRCVRRLLRRSHIEKSQTREELRSAIRRLLDFMSLTDASPTTFEVKKVTLRHARFLSFSKLTQYFQVECRSSMVVVNMYRYMCDMQK